VKPLCLFGIGIGNRRTEWYLAVENVNGLAAQIGGCCLSTAENGDGTILDQFEASNKATACPSDLSGKTLSFVSRPLRRSGSCSMTRGTKNSSQKLQKPREISSRDALTGSSCAHLSHNSMLCCPVSRVLTTKSARIHFGQKKRRSVQCRLDAKIGNSPSSS
jgi:hypothetical protein